jgi:hypothetical protein
MENHLDRPNHVEEPGPEYRPKPTGRDLLLGTLVAALFAFAVVVAAILTFDVNPAGPVIVVVAAIVAGSYAYRHLHDYAFKAAAIGLVVGGVAAILFWPFFDVA